MASSEIVLINEKTFRKVGIPKDRSDFVIAPAINRVKEREERGFLSAAEEVEGLGIDDVLKGGRSGRQQRMLKKERGGRGERKGKSKKQIKSE